jgi:hypothetical protein
LPHSNVEVRMATKFNKYEESIEKIGIEPMLRVSPGVDALKYLNELE